MTSLGIFIMGCVFSVLLAFVNVFAAAGCFSFFSTLGLFIAVNEILAELRLLNTRSEWMERVEAKRFREQFPDSPWKLADMRQADKEEAEAEAIAVARVAAQKDRAATAKRIEEERIAAQPVFRSPEVIPDVPANFKATKAAVDFSAIDSVAEQPKRRPPARPQTKPKE